MAAQDKAVSASDFGWLVGSLCQLNRIPFDPALLFQKFPAPHSFQQLIEALRSFGFRTGEGRISKAAYPCVGFLAGEDKKPALLIKRDPERLLYFVAGSQAPQTAPVGTLKEKFDADVLLVRHESAKEPAHEDGAPAVGKFGFRWFWTELLKHKRVWRDVLLASCFIQLIGLTTPIGTQVVIDKVVVHQTDSTLIAIAVGLGMFMLFAAGMSWLRQDLRTQEFIIRSNLALIEQSERKIAQITADYRRQLRTERVEIAAQADKLRQKLAKQAHRQELLELRAPQAGTVKDLATHTIGTVAAPGTILMTLVPQGDTLIAEVWLGNQDVGFVRPGQEVKLKLAAFQFQKYGMIEGVVHHISADATEAPSANTRSDALGGRDRPMGPLAYRALVELKSQELAVEGAKYALAPGMQVSSEINLGTRTILEYVLSPVQKAWHEAGRER